MPPRRFIGSYLLSNVKKDSGAVIFIDGDALFHPMDRASGWFLFVLRHRFGRLSASPGFAPLRSLLAVVAELAEAPLASRSSCFGACAPLGHPGLVVVTFSFPQKKK